MNKLGNYDDDYAESIRAADADADREEIAVSCWWCSMLSSISLSIPPIVVKITSHRRRIGERETWPASSCDESRR